MKKNCATCENRPAFEFFSPTHYEAHGYCDAFDTEPEIIEHEDTGDDCDYYYTCEGQVITDCPLWEPEELPEEECVGNCFKYKRETDPSVQSTPTKETMMTWDYLSGLPPKDRISKLFELFGGPSHNSMNIRFI